LSNTLNDVKATVRSIIGDDDPNGWLKDTYLVPKINFSYRTQTLYIKRATGMNLEKMVEIPNATDGAGNNSNQGLTTLAKFQQPGGFLDGLYEPLYLWWKPAGASELWYREMREKKTILPGQSVPGGGGGQPITSTWWGGNASFTWRGNQIFITPFSVPVDFLVDGRFNPPALVKDEDVLIADPDMEICVTPATIAIIGVESGNAGYQAMQTEAEAAADDIVAKIVRQKQGFTARAGSNQRRQRGCGWGWW
jgi:hypothetical protein